VALGREQLGTEGAMVNRVTVDYVLGRGYKVDSFIGMLMIDEPSGGYDDCVPTDPPFSAQIGSV
jgi:hypothetical protein